jgi:cell division protein FtsZ
MKISSAMDIIYKDSNESADIIFGTTTDGSLADDFIRITVVATGFEKVPMVPVNNVF